MTKEELALLKNIHICLPPQMNKSLYLVIINKIESLVCEYKMIHIEPPNIIIMPKIYHTFLCEGYGEFGKEKKVRQVMGMKIIAIEEEIPMQVYREVGI